MKQADRIHWRCLAGCSLRNAGARKIYEVRKSSTGSGVESELAYGKITWRVQAASQLGHFSRGLTPQRMFLADATVVHPKGTREGVVHLLVDPATVEEGDLVALMCDKCRQTPTVSVEAGGVEWEGPKLPAPAPPR